MTAGTRGHDDVGESIAIHIAGRDEDTSAIKVAVGFKVPEGTRQGIQRRTVEDTHGSAAAKASAGDEIIHAVAVDVACGDSHAAFVAGGEGLKLGLQRRTGASEGVYSEGISCARADGEGM